MAEWTISELSERVAEALAEDYDAPENGQVRAVPNQRTIRYYTTLGLLSRPAAMRGRTALYDSRHLAQLVAIKRLQAEGLALSEIQARLAGAQPDDIVEIAKIDVEVPVEPTRSAPSREFWRQKPQTPTPTPAAPARPPLPAVQPAPPSAPAKHVTHLELTPGVALLIDRTDLSAADLANLRRAAAPLLAALAAAPIRF